MHMVPSAIRQNGLEFSSRRFAVCWLLSAKFMPDRLWVANRAVWRLGPVRPEVENDPVGLGRYPGNLLCLRFWHVQDLHTTCRNLYFMIMIELVPDIQRYMRSGN